MQEFYGDYAGAEGAAFKGPLLPHGARALDALVGATGWTSAKAVRRAVRAFAFHLAAHPEIRIEAQQVVDPSAFVGRYDTGMEAEAIAGVEAVARRFGVRRNAVVAAALQWYASTLPSGPARPAARRAAGRSAPR